MSQQTLGSAISPFLFNFQGFVLKLPLALWICFDFGICPKLLCGLDLLIGVVADGLATGLRAKI